VVYAIVTEHGGEIELDDETPRGACFMVRLPAGAAADIEPAPPEPPEQGGGSTVRVLLVDENGREAMRLMEGLADAGLEVRHAPSLANAEAIARSWQPDVVVAAAEVPDGVVAPWVARRGLPAVMLGSSPKRESNPPGAIELERAAATDAVLAAVRRVTSSHVVER